MPFCSSGLAGALVGVLVMMAVFSSAAARAQTLDVPVSTVARPRLLLDVGIDQKLGGRIPLDLAFRDETGATVALGKYFGERPVIFALVYYECPMLCTQVLNGMLRSLKQIRFDAGKEFQVLVVSINPREKPPLAEVKKRLYAGLYERPGTEEGWHFLTGEDSSIAPLAKAAGFRYAYDPETQQYAHASAIMVLTPTGTISRYFYGIQYPARDLRLGLVEAADGKIGSPVDQILLFCYHYDPATGKYGLVILNIVRAAGLATVLGLAAFITLMFRRERTA
jgi:protein SCO1/2